MSFALVPEFLSAGTQLLKELFSVDTFTAVELREPSRDFLLNLLDGVFLTKLPSNKEMLYCRADQGRGILKPAGLELRLDEFFCFRIERYVHTRWAFPRTEYSAMNLANKVIELLRSSSPWCKSGFLKKKVA